MWNLEQTEQLVVRLIPVAIIVAAVVIALLNARVKPEQLAPAFAPAPVAIERAR
jgi:hypothetical protein